MITAIAHVITSIFAGIGNVLIAIWSFSAFSPMLLVLQSADITAVTCGKCAVGDEAEQPHISGWWGVRRESARHMASVPPDADILQDIDCLPSPGSWSHLWPLIRPYHTNLIIQIAALPLACNSPLDYNHVALAGTRMQRDFFSFHCPPSLYWQAFISRSCKVVRKSTLWW